MAALLSLEQCSEYVTALAQLVEEFDFHYSNSAVQFMKKMQSKMQSDDGGEETDLTAGRPRLAKRYKFLRLLPEGAPLDPGQVVVILCNLLGSAYQRLEVGVQSSTSVCAIVLRIDALLSEH